MKLMEVLVNLPIEELQQIAYKTGTSGFFHSKADLIRNLFEQLIDHDFVSCLLRKLPTKNKELLKLLIITEKNPTKAGKHKSSSNTTYKQYERDKYFKMLREYGLIFLISGKYIIPEELGEKIIECFQSELYQDFIVSSPPKMEIQSQGLHYYHDIYHLLSFISKNELKLTQKEKIYSRTYQRLQKLLLTPDKEWSVFCSNNGTTRLQTIIDFCLSKGLIERRKSYLKLTDQIEQWIEQPFTDQVRSVLSFFLDRIISDVPQATQGMALLQNIETDKWIDASQFLQKISLMAPSANQENVDTHILFQRFIEPLYCLGFVNMGSANGISRIFQMTNLGKEILSNDNIAYRLNDHDPIVIQPNFELLVPQNIPYIKRWKLEDIATMTAVGNMITYSVTKDSLMNGMKKRLTANEIITMLADLSKNDLPQNVKQTILDWSEMYGQVLFMSAAILHCKRPDVAKIITSIPALQKLIITQLTPVDLVIKSDAVDIVREVLESNEIIPVPDICAGETVFSFEKNE